MKASKKSTHKYKNDTDRIVHRHLENKEDKITEDDLKSVRIGVSTDEDVATGAEAESKFGIKKLIAKRKSSKAPKEDKSGKNIDQPTQEHETPWDILK